MDVAEDSEDDDEFNPADACSPPEFVCTPEEGPKPHISGDALKPLAEDADFVRLSRANLKKEGGDLIHKAWQSRMNLTSFCARARVCSL